MRRLRCTTLSEPLRFHAVPPQGQWLNDPNALLYAGGRFHLFAQHRADGPDFRQTGWARFASPDLLQWDFQGLAIAPEAHRWAYSGCIVAENDEDLRAIHTEHSQGKERQVVRTSADGGLTWSAPAAQSGLGPPARNRRDPFVVAREGGWLLVLAEPCDWHDWEREPPSRLQLYRSADLREWVPAGAVGPWRPPGVMWEVPVIATIGGRDTLIVSEVDRRAGRADCCVRAWTGHFADDGFHRDIPDGEGQLLDHGPEFYAMTRSIDRGWPFRQPAFVGWASNWNVARTAPWPGFAGGPIGFPRALSRRGATIAVDPHPEALGAFVREASGPGAAGLFRVQLPGPQGSLAIRAGSARLHVTIDRSAEMVGFDRPAWEAMPAVRSEARLVRPEESEVLILCDGPLCEVFAGGVAATFLLGAGDECEVTAPAGSVMRRLRFEGPASAPGNHAGNRRDDCEAPRLD
jgi:hypothetical protein